MRRWSLIGSVCLAVLITLAGCGKPEGVDGDLVNGWPEFAEAKLTIPTAPACYSVNQEPADVNRWPAPVACDAQHTVETIFVGAFEEAPQLPAAGGPERRKAYEDCAAKANEFLGADWRIGIMDMSVVVPTQQHWEAGARWYRCDLVEYQDLQTKPFVARTSSLKGQLAEGSKLRIGCVAVTTTADGKAVEKMLPSDCTAAHTGEFAGLWEAPDGPYQADAALRSETNLAGCKAVVAGYTGIPNDANFQYRTGQVAIPFTKNQWDLGNRGVRCYVWTGKAVTTSLKGAGVAGLPINYAN